MPESHREGPPEGPEAAPATTPSPPVGGIGDRPLAPAPAAAATAATTDTDALELPATFGKYYLTEKLATGGM
ncbi:MAG TPA: hypothetical protein VGD80_08575, partial [Kofleriaceae bacterium]